MIQEESNLGINSIALVDWPTRRWLDVAATILATTAIVASAFHFWPFTNNKLWQMSCLSNSAVLAWSLTLAGYLLLERTRFKISSILPHLSIFAYVYINILSSAFASNVGRTVGFTVKLGLVLFGGYTLFSSVIHNAKSLKIIYRVATIALIISVCYCLVSRFGFGAQNFGFHGNAYKYGTYIGMLTPLCSIYLLTSSKSWGIMIGVLLVIGAIISSGSLGVLAAITTGIMAAVIITPKWVTKFGIVAALICGIGLTILLNSHPATLNLQNDIKLAEKDNTNLKQRYLEWQAEMNLLEKRTITGTGAGCINDYRSNFYYRLPKLNTLKPFDQNGWLATSAETGILGLMCFCWIIMHYGKLALLQAITVNPKGLTTVSRFALANFAGFISACIANIFSSVHYNGIIIIFVLVLALISQTNKILGEQPNASKKVN